MPAKKVTTVENTKNTFKSWLGPSFSGVSRKRGRCLSVNVIGSSEKNAPQKMSTTMSNRSRMALFDENTMQMVCNNDKNIMGSNLNVI